MMSDAAYRLDENNVTSLGASAIRQPDPQSALPEATGESVIDWFEVLERYGRKPRKYPIWEVTVENKPFEVVVSKQGSLWCAENEHYNVLVHGCSISEALNEALEAVQYLAAELLDEADDSLSEYARLLKSRYAQLRFH